MINAEKVETIVIEGHELLDRIPSVDAPEASEAIVAVFDCVYGNLKNEKIDVIAEMGNGNAVLSAFFERLMAFVEMLPKPLPAKTNIIARNISIILGDACNNQKQYVTAEQHYCAYLRYLEELPEQYYNRAVLSQEASVLLSLSGIYHETGKLNSAAELLQKAVEKREAAEKNSSLFDPDLAALYEELYEIYREEKEKKKATLIKRRLLQRAKQYKLADPECRKIYFWNFIKKTILFPVLCVELCLVVIQFSLIAFTGTNLISAIRLYQYDRSYVFTFSERTIKKQFNQTKNRVLSLGYELQAQGDYESAISCYYEALSQLKGSHSDDELCMACLRAELGSCCLALDRLDEAYEHYISAYTTFNKCLGAKHELTNEALDFLALIKIRAGDFERSISDFVESFKNIRYYGTRIQISRSAGNALYHAGKMDDALAWMYRSLGYFDCIYGKWGESGYRARSNTEHCLGIIYYSLGNLEEAERWHLSAFDNITKSLELLGGEGSSRHYSILSAICLDLSDVYFDLFDFGRSVDFMDLAEEAILKNPNTDLTSLYELSIIRVERPLIQQLENLSVKQADFLKKFETFGIPDELRELPIYQDAYSVALYMALEEILSGQYDARTESFLFETLNRMTEQSDEHNLLVIRELLLISAFYMGTDDEKALEYCTLALERVKDDLMKESPLNAGLCREMAMLFLTLHDDESAIHSAVESFKICYSIYECQSAATIESLDFLHLILSSCGQEEKALTIAQLVLKMCDEFGFDKDDYSSGSLQNSAFSANQDEASAKNGITPMDRLFSSMKDSSLYDAVFDYVFAN